MATQLKNVSILTIGEAKGHNLLIDETTLQEALAVAQSMGRIKVTNGHGAQQVMDILGYVENFKIEGNRLIGDLTLLNSEKADYVRDLAETMPDQFGLSITFSGVPREIDGSRYASVTEIYDVSVVVTPAANKSLFSAFSALPVDSLQKAMANTIEAPVAKLEAPAEAAPAAPAAPVAVFNAEEAIAALAAKIEELSQKLTELSAPAVAEVMEEAPAAPVAEPAVEAAAETKAEEAVVEAPVANEAAALKAEVAHMKIELEASRGIKPLEVSAEKNFSRADLLSQFNAEKDPRRAAEIFKQIKLAR